MPEIRVIEPIIFAPAEKLRVCAYARVSSDSTDQRNSFASQVNYYTKYIQAHEGWTFVDIYADQGITGTSALKRDEFLRLMRDCRQGKIDRILVKSVSRFARNAQDCIEAVRELRQLGVTVYFEKEHGNHFCFVVRFSFVLSFCKMFDILLVLILFLFSVPFLFVKKRYGVRGSPRQTVCRTAAVAASIQTLCLPIP